MLNPIVSYLATSLVSALFNRQSPAPEAAKPPSPAVPSADKLSLSSAGRGLAARDPSRTLSTPPMFLVGPVTHLPPAGADAVEQMAYSRDAIAVDTSGIPYRFKDTGEPVTYGAWLAREQAIDRRVEGRIAVYQQAKAEGLGNDQILARIQAYDKSLPTDASHQTYVPGPRDISRVGEPAVSDEDLLTSLNQRRQEYFQAVYG